MQTLSNVKSIKGIITALVTPFSDTGSIDWQQYNALLESQLEAHIDGVVVCGTTGETPTLSEEETTALIDQTVKKCSGKTLVIAGTGSNCTQKTIKNCKTAQDLGVDAALVVTPYYNKPTQSGLKSHFLKIADDSKIPILLYNVPGRTQVSLAPKTISEIAEHPNVIGIKEASGNLQLLTQIRTAVKKLPKKNFSFLTGDDVTFWPFLTSGGDGNISVASNVIPKQMKKIYNHFLQMNYSEGLALYEQLHGFLQMLFIETNPIPIKKALSWSKLKTSANYRLPLVGLENKNELELKQIWDQLSSHLKE